MEPKDMELAEDEVHLGVYCLHMSSDSDRELECIGSREPVGSNDDRNESQPVNNQGVAFRTRRAKDSVDGSSRKSSRHWCSCCEQNSPKEKKKKQTNKASKDPAEAQAFPVVDERTDGENVAFQDPERDLTSSPSRKRATWNPSDEIELASAVLDGINSGLGGVKCGTDVMDVKSHKQFWEDVSGNIQSKIGHDRSKNQIIEKFRKLKIRFFTNAEQKQSADRSSEGHEGQLFSILQQVFGTKEEQSVNLQETLQNPSGLRVIGNEDQVSLKRHRDNKGPTDLKNSVQDQVTEAANGVEEAGVEPLSPGEERALSKAKHREELASAILDGIKSGLDAVEVGADLTCVESFNQFWENITEILQKKTGQVQSKYQIIQEFRKMQESHVASAMQQPSAVQTNDGHEEQLFRILQQNAGDEREQDISDTALKERVKGSEDQASKPETRSILDQEGRQGGKMSCNGISYVLCLPSPNQTIIWSLQNHGTRKKKPEGRDLQDEMFTDAKDQEHDLSSPVQKKSGKAAKNNPSYPVEKKLVHTSESDLSSVVQKKLFKDSKSNQNCREQKDSVKVLMNNPSSPISPGKKPVKRKSSYEVTIAEVISKVSQSSKRRKLTNQFSEKILGEDLESSPSLKRKELANTLENAKGSSPVKSVKAAKINLSPPGKELAETLESAKRSSQTKLANSPESNLSSPRQKKLAITPENNLSSVSLYLPRRKSAKRNSQYEVTIAEMISNCSLPSKKSKSARVSSQKKSLEASESNPSCPQQELPKTSENAEQPSQKKMAEASETNLSFLELKASANSSQNLKQTSQNKSTKGSRSNLFSPEQQELANTSENAKQLSETKSVKASETNASSPEQNESVQALENAKQPPRKKLAKASKRNLSSQKISAKALENNQSLLEENELTMTSENAKQLSETKSVKASETNASSPEQNESVQALENAKQPPRKKLAKALKRNLSSKKILAKALENNQSLLEEKELTMTSENKRSSPISSKRKLARQDSQHGVTISEMISKVRQSSKMCKSAKRSLLVELNIPAEALESNQQFLSKVKSADQTSPNEHGSVSQVSDDGGVTQVLLETKPNKWRSNEEIAIASAVLDAIKSGQFDVKLGCDNEWGKHLKLWEQVHKQIQSKTNKECTVNQVAEKFMKMRKKFLNMREIPSRKDRICLGKHEQLFDIYQEIWHNEQSTAPPEEKSEMNKASPVSENVTSEMNVSQCLEVVLPSSTCTGTQDEQHKQMEDLPGRENCDSSAGIKQVQDKCRELQTEEETEMNKTSIVSENITLEINVSNCLEVVPQPSLCTGTQNEHHKHMEDSPARANCDSSAGNIQVRDKYEELQTEEEIEMKKASPVSGNVALEINVPKCLEVVPLPSICTERRDERHKQQMEDSPVREICDSSAGIKHVQDKCEELRNETRAICVEMWQDCEEKFQDMQSRINEMLDNKMKELKETHAIQDNCFNERRLFFGEESSGSNGSREIHLLMDKHLKYRSRKLQLMQELCKIEEEELETQHLMSQLKELRSHNLL